MKGADMPKYLVIGCLGIDTIIFEDGRSIPRQPGGDAYYGAVGAHIWDPSVGIVAVVPRTYPQEWLDTLQAGGVDTVGVFRNQGTFGLEGTITYQADGTRLLGAQDGVLRFIQEYLPGLLVLLGKSMWPKVCPNGEHIPPSYLDAHAAFIAAAAPGCQASCLRALRGKVGTILLDPPPLLPGQKHGRVHDDLADLSLVDYLLPSEQECSEYWGDDVQPGEAAAKFFDLGARKVVLKQGARGVSLFLGRDVQPIRVPVYPTQVVDTTGAGDSFGGGFMVGLAETGDPIKAACYGAVSSSFVIEGFGADHALQVTRQQAEERLQVLLGSLKK
jgi:ribokinase